jgi:transcriptional regulator with XRE-family HTH domain
MPRPLDRGQCDRQAAGGVVSASRAALLRRLAERSGVSLRTIAHFEAGERQPIPANLAALQTALESAGVEFTNGDAPGVRLHKVKPVVPRKAKRNTKR